MSAVADLEAAGPAGRVLMEARAVERDLARTESGLLAAARSTVNDSGLVRILTNRGADLVFVHASLAAVGRDLMACRPLTADCVARRLEDVQAACNARGRACLDMAAARSRAASRVRGSVALRFWRLRHVARRLSRLIDLES